jgi:hypothetical protein
MNVYEQHSAELDPLKADKADENSGWTTPNSKEVVP